MAWSRLPKSPRPRLLGGREDNGGNLKPLSAGRIRFGRGIIGDRYLNLDDSRLRRMSHTAQCVHLRNCRRWFPHSSPCTGPGKGDIEAHGWRRRRVTPCLANWKRSTPSASFHSCGSQSSNITHRQSVRSSPGLRGATRQISAGSPQRRSAQLARSG